MGKQVLLLWQCMPFGGPETSTDLRNSDTRRG